MRRSRQTSEELAAEALLELPSQDRRQLTTFFELDLAIAGKFNFVTLDDEEQFGCVAGMAMFCVLTASV